MSKFKKAFWPENLKEIRWDLFQINGIKNFFYQRRNFIYIRTFGDVIFIFIILFGLFGPQEKDRNPILFLTWGIWWPSVVLSWFFLGRMWCAFCPFPGLARLIQKIKLSLGKKPSPWLEKYRVYLASTLFFLIIWLETITPLTEVPRYTASLILGVIMMAGLLGVIYTGYAWCRYLCPLGHITGVASTMALIEFRPNLSICKNCKETHCRKSTTNISGCPIYLGAVAVKNNLHCFICGHCLILCPHNSPKIYLRHPLKEIIANKGKGVTCSYIIPFLIGSQISRFIVETPQWETFLSAIHLDKHLVFTLLFLFLSVAILVLSRFTILILGFFEDPLFGRFNLAIASLIPLSFTGELVYRLKYFFQELDDFQLTLINLLQLEFLRNKLISVPSAFIVMVGHFLLFISLCGMLYITFYFYAKEFEKEIHLKRYTGIILLDLTLFFLYVILFRLSF